MATAPAHAEHVTPELVARVLKRTLRDQPDQPFAILPAADPTWQELEREAGGDRGTWLAAAAILRDQGTAHIAARCLPGDHPTATDPAVTVFVTLTEEG